MTQADVAVSADEVSFSQPSIRKAVMAGVFGTVMEWYDLVTYGFLAQIIGRSFFPAHDDAASLLAAFASFGVGYLARPLGGLVLGAYADRYGRRSAMMLSLLLMAFSTLAIGLTPTYATIGVAAPVVLVAARILQGISAGGESPTAYTFLVEWAPHGKRGLFGSFNSMASGCGLLVGSSMLAVLTAFLTPDTMQSWGWRIPFVIGFLVGPFGIWIRRSVGETPAFRRAQTQTVSDARPPVMAAAKTFVFLIFWSVGYYVFLTYMPTFSVRHLHLTTGESIRSNTIALLVYVCCIPFFGWLSDKVGRKPLLIVSCALFCVLSYPAFAWLLAGSSASALLAVQILFVVLLAMYSGPSGATLAEMFPTRSRTKWMAIGYSLSAAIFGGFTPFAVTWLISDFHTPMAVAYYVIAFAVIGGVFVCSIGETSRSELR